MRKLKVVGILKGNKVIKIKGSLRTTGEKHKDLNKNA